MQDGCRLTRGDTPADRRFFVGSAIFVVEAYLGDEHFLGIDNTGDVEQTYAPYALKSTWYEVGFYHIIQLPSGALHILLVCITDKFIAVSGIRNERPFVTCGLSGCKFIRYKKIEVLIFNTL